MKSGVVVLFGLTSFLAAALLFSVQPMIGKMVLPVLGGTPAVWTTCLVYFQVMLLGGYLFAHGVNLTEGGRAAAGSALFTCPCWRCCWRSVMCFSRSRSAPAYRELWSVRNPAIILLGVLAVSATLPLLMVSATAPLLQCWFALTPHPRAQRSVLPVCREQCRKLDGAPGLSVRDRAGLGFELAEPALADWFSATGDPGSCLWCHRSPVEPVAGRSSEALPSERPRQREANVSPRGSSFGGSFWSLSLRAGSWA